MCHLESKTKGLQYIPGDRKYPLADNRATRYCKIDDLQGLYNALQCFSPVLPVCTLSGQGDDTLRYRGRKWTLLPELWALICYYSLL